MVETVPITSMGSMAIPQIDHVVLLLPYKDLMRPPPWIARNFIVTPGGRSKDGQIENRLIMFEDGSYIELIAFINDSTYLRNDHPYGTKHHGLIDFALTTPGTLDYTSLHRRITRCNSRIRINYSVPVERGRKNPGGAEIRYTITAPEPSITTQHNSHGQIPLWCHDLTPRDRRVPLTMDNTDHPCGAIGIAQLTLRVHASSKADYTDLYSAIMGTTPVWRLGNAMLPLDTPETLPDVPRPWLVVEGPQNGEDEVELSRRGVGISEIFLRVGRKGERGPARESIREEGVMIHFSYLP
ncbi:glyoxalase-like domain-containing protein [Pyronema domesticum]|uniref:Glyoxalase-like domain-containing protein n=1 Tax=Pyronema omphalodes (strain CBS 100304) TaxID=1076935 RepID=U4LJK9_PYROM|nr:glyoxalase-like domain-containing protein [Pyronema domesticum]CCX32269.1 Similar to hypothetical protein [Tuber melanosporum Mel28]; acc. no. XP_002837765 [Pyronema omphalodes CBS 100304]